MIDWCPFAVRRDGPAGKAGYPNVFLPGAPKLGEIKHSAEGGWGGAHSVLDGPSRASWHFSIGDYIEQHYPVPAYTWHAGDTDDDGGIRGNIQLVGIEHLGTRPTPIDDDQLALTVRLTRWLMATNGYAVAVRGKGVGEWSLYEHNEVSDVPTACPSGRIRWREIRDQLTGGDMFVRANGSATFFKGRQYTPANGYEMQLGVDFQNVLPANAKAVELDVRIDPTTTGALVMRDGDGRWADELNRFKSQAIVRVIPDANKRVMFDVLGSPVKFQHVGLVGVWN